MKNKIILPFLLLSVSFFYTTGQTAQGIVRSIGVGEITVMELGGDGDIWIGTESGLFHYSSSYTFEGQYFSGTWVNAITFGYIGSNPYAFAGTTSGLLYVDSGVPGSVSNSELPSTNISALAFTPAKNLYAFTPGSGAVLLDSNLASTGNPALPLSNIVCAVSSACGGYIAGSPDSGAFYTTDYVHDTVLQTPDIISDSVTAVGRTTNCAAWLVGTRNGFSFCPTGHPCQNFTSATTHDSLPENYITSISLDCKGNIWLGMRDSGIVIYTPPTQTFQRLILPDSLSQVTALAANPDSCSGLNYVGTANGNVALLDTNNTVVQILSSVQNIPDNPFNISLFPQPAANKVNFLFENELKNGQFCLTDMNGRILGYYNLKNTHNFTLDVSNLSAGLYVYKILENGEMLKAGKVEVVR